MVKDLRTNYEVSDPDSVLEGDLDDFILNYLSSSLDEDDVSVWIEIMLSIFTSTNLLNSLPSKQYKWDIVQVIASWDTAAIFTASMDTMGAQLLKKIKVRIVHRLQVQKLGWML